jgi:hypothetical protein
MKKRFIAHRGAAPGRSVKDSWHFVSAGHLLPCIRAGGGVRVPPAVLQHRRCIRCEARAVCRLLPVQGQCNLVPTPPHNTVILLDPELLCFCHPSGFSERRLLSRRLRIYPRRNFVVVFLSFSDGALIVKDISRLGSEV